MSFGVCCRIFSVRLIFCWKFSIWTLHLFLWKDFTLKIHSYFGDASDTHLMKHISFYQSTSLLIAKSQSAKFFFATFSFSDNLRLGVRSEKEKIKTESREHTNEKLGKWNTGKSLLRTITWFLLKKWSHYQEGKERWSDKLPVEGKMEIECRDLWDCWAVISFVWCKFFKYQNGIKSWFTK